MGWYTDWFIADETDADAVASIATTEEYSFEDWPHLSMKSVGEMELLSLWAVLLGQTDHPKEQLEQALVIVSEEEGPVVSRVSPAFIDAIAALKKSDVKRIAGAWHKHEELSDWELGTVSSVLRELVDFAQRAKREGKPVLQLSVW